MRYTRTVYAETTAYPEDFIRVLEGDVVILKVNLPRAHLKKQKFSEIKYCMIYSEII